MRETADLGDPFDASGGDGAMLGSTARALVTNCEPHRCAAVPQARGEAPLTAAELTQRRSDDAYRLALPVLESSAEHLAQTRSVLSFFDTEGWRLWVGGGDVARERLCGIGIVLGTSCLHAAAACGHALVVSDAVAPHDGDAGEVAARRRRPVSCAALVVVPGTRERAGVVCIAGPAGSLERRMPIAAQAVARAVGERLRSARQVREHVVQFALEAATAAGDALLAMDLSGRVIAANDAARGRLGFEGLDAPAPVRQVLGASGALAAAPCELTVECPGASGEVRLLVSPVRYERHATGVVVRVLERPMGPRPRVRGAPASPGSATRYGFRQILGESAALRAATALAQTAALNDLPVVVTGESGTGKELFAQAIHSASARRGEPFVAVNCGSIPASLLEAELFGYEPGTFTGGSREGKPGKFEEAAGGTVFLDEVSELSPQAQTALLRVLQEKEVVRLGGSTPRPVDLRVVAATNRPLLDEIKAGRFRADLYFRLHVLATSVPPLRERRDDVRLLARELLAVAEAEIGRAGLALSESALRALEAYGWPGNVRELRNVILRSAATAPGTVIEARDLPLEVQEGGEARGHERRPWPAAAVGDGGGREALLKALEACSWNVARTAQILRVSRMTLYRWFRKHGIER
jgi:sigma-54 dependent transcriptional regulator, acetoin dehydrogenase operon transcriptional activator AcoR